MFKSSQRVDYSLLHEEEDETIQHQDLLHSHPNSVLVANHHGECNIVPLLSSQTLGVNNKVPAHSPRTSFSVPDATRRFFSTKLPIAFRKDMGSTASFSSLPPVIIADFQNGDIPEFNGNNLENTQVGDQGWVIIHRRRFKGKHGIGETRHPVTRTNTNTSNDSDIVLDEEIDPSDQVTCSVFVKWTPTTEESQQSQQYTMSTRLYDTTKAEPEEERVLYK